MLATDPRSFHESFIFSESTSPSFSLSSCSNDLHLLFTQNPHGLFSLCTICLPLWVVLSLYLCDFVFILQDFLSKPLSFSFLYCSFFSQAVTSSAMPFSFYWDVRFVTSGILSFNSLLLSPLISHDTPPHFSSVDFRKKRLYWCVLCLLL